MEEVCARIQSPGKKRGRPPKKVINNGYFKQGGDNPTFKCIYSPMEVSINSEDSSQLDNIKRPHRDVYQEATLSSGNNLIGGLRPEKGNKLNGGTCDKIHNNGSEGENIIVNFQKLNDAISAFILPHSANTKCREPRPQTYITKRNGLCITVSILCTRCRFRTDNVPLFEEVRFGSRGPVSGSLNNRLALSVMKTKAGASDISFILACLDIKPPSSSLLYSKVNNLADKMVDLNTEAMKTNQEFVNEVNHLTGKTTTDISTDNAFNNRPAEGYEAGTQSVAAVTELNTSRKLPIELSTANKLCSKPNCRHEDEKCYKTYGTHDSIASSEGKLATKNLTKLEDAKILQIGSVTTDASTQLEKAVRDFSTHVNKPIRHYTCFIHFMRTFKKHVKKLTLKSNIPGNQKDIFKNQLAACTRRRVYQELVKIKRNSPSEEAFLHKAGAAISNLIPCFSNNHKNCQDKSAVCTEHLGINTSKFLPFGKPLDLCVEDKNNLESIISTSLCEIRLKKISRLLNTNKNENLHTRIFTYSPKCSTYSRNFNALCHSALHSDTFGTGLSCLHYANYLGILPMVDGPMYKHMMRRDFRTHYHRTKKNCFEYKQKRAATKKAKGNRKLLQNCLYANCAHELLEEHGYALNPK